MKLGRRYHNTPVKMQKLGDSLIGVSSTIAGYALVDEIKWLGLTALAIGVVGKFLLDYFEETPSNDED